MLCQLIISPHISPRVKQAGHNWWLGADYVSKCKHTAIFVPRYYHHFTENNVGRSGDMN